MDPSSFISELLERNQTYAKAHTPKPFVTEFPSDFKGPRLLIFVCCDGRVDPEAILGLKVGEAIVVRNAGCQVPRNLADLLVLDHLRDLKEILIIQHTDCGVTYTTDEAIRGGVRKVAPGHKDKIKIMEFGTFKNTFASTADRARQFVDFVKASPFVRPELAQNTVGAVYDIKTGIVLKVT